MQRRNPTAQRDEAAATTSILTNRQVLSLFSETSLKLDRAFEVADSNKLHDTFLEHSIDINRVVASGVSINDLQRLGTSTIKDFSALGMNALHLRDATVASQMLGIFGRDAIFQEYVSTPIDASNIAGSAGARALGIDPNMLLSVCAGSPSHALVVLLCSGRPSEVCDAIDVATLIDTGLRSKMLSENGFGLALLSRSKTMTHRRATLLGFKNVLSMSTNQF